MSALEVATEHARARRDLAEDLRDEARLAWLRVDPRRISETWIVQIARLLLAFTAGQLAAARTADDYLAAVLDEQGLNPAGEGSVAARGFAGVASDGRPLSSLLSMPAITAKVAIQEGASVEYAMASGQALTELIAHTQVADAGRVADQVAMAARREATGQVRMVVGKTCARCLILAGRWYRWNAGFNRHPKCDCIGIPGQENTVGDLRTDPKAAFAAMPSAEQDRAFGKAGAEAIRNGADMAKVVNARRGMYTADGRLYTREAAGRRPRLMPEQILREASGDRDEALRLLRLHGYLI